MDLNILKDLCGGMKDQEKLMDIVNDIKEDNRKVLFINI